MSTHALEPNDVLEMSMSLVCRLPKCIVTDVLLGEDYSEQDIKDFIEYCESK